MICPVWLSEFSVALRSHRGGHALTGGLAAKEVVHAPQHPGKLDARLLVRADVGAERVSGRGQDSGDSGSSGDDSNTVHT